MILGILLGAMIGLGIAYAICSPAFRANDIDRETTETIDMTIDNGNVDGFYYQTTVDGATNGVWTARNSFRPGVWTHFSVTYNPAQTQTWQTWQTPQTSLLSSAWVRSNSSLSRSFESWYNYAKKGKTE